MEVVYLFCESDVIRIPFYDYDRRLFNLLVSKGGAWDKSRYQFIFGRNINVQQFCRSLSDIPCVLVLELIGEKSPVPLRVFNFLNRPWKQDVYESAKMYVKSFKQVKVNNAVFDLSLLPEKFPEHWQIKLEEEMRARKYSSHTQKSYVHYNRLLCRIAQKTPEDICQNDITRFLAIMEKENDYSSSTMNLAISAIKFFYKMAFREKALAEQHRPRHDKRLPVVLSKEEISSILKCEKNIKNRLLIMMAYSSGLRVSEVVCLKPQDIDFSRKLIMIHSGKGRKDRYTILSDKVITLLTDYYSQNDIIKWLFPGLTSEKHISIRTAQRICDNAFKKAKINKDTSIHCLRHSFATHLLENGIDIRYIQELLGHTSIRTTERYTHVATHKISNVPSPLDSIQ